MKLVGESVPRVEDRRILTGRGRYVDDLKLPNMLQAAFVRSPFPHARIQGIDVASALASPGVVAVFTGEQVKALTQPIGSPLAVGLKWPVFYALAVERVRFVGDPVAMVVAESRYQAEDACELVEVDYEPLTAVVDYADALDPAKPLLFEELGENVVVVNEAQDFGDVEGAFREADRVVSATLHQHRIANVPMETRGAVADFDPSSEELTFHAATQNPHGLRMQLGATLGHPMERLRVLAGDIGGGFGLKGMTAREDYCVALASKQLHRPVKWIEDRNEHLLASGHAREESVEAEVAVKDDGTLLGIKARLSMDLGAYPSVPFASATYPGIVQLMFPGPYRMKGFRYEASVASTNKAVYVAYRGPWAVETWLRERLLDIVADELGLDPAEIRRRNLVAGDPEDRLVTGLSLAGVTARESLDRALARIDYDAVREAQAAERAEGRCVGTGFACMIEGSPGPVELRSGGGSFASERAKVALQPDGHLIVTTPQCPHGQSHETTLAQVAAEEMGVPLDHVRVVYGDTRQVPFTVLGTGGSRAATWASGSVIVTTRKLKEQVLAIASGMLEIGVEDLGIIDGVVTPRGAPQKSIPLAQIAMQAMLDPGNLPPGTDRRLEGRRDLHRRVGEGQRLDHRDPRLHGGDRSRHGPGPHPPLRGGGGLRPHHPPGDRRRPDPRRCGPGDRTGALRARRLRRRRQLPGRHLPGLPAAHQCRDPADRDRAPVRATSPASSSSAVWARAE